MINERENTFISNLSGKKLNQITTLNRILSYGINRKYYEKELTENDQKALFEILYENTNDISVSVSRDEVTVIKTPKINRDETNYKALITVKKNYYKEVLLPLINSSLLELKNGFLIDVKSSYSNSSVIINLKEVEDVYKINEIIKQSSLDRYLLNPILFVKRVGKVGYIKSEDFERYFVALSLLLSGYLKFANENKGKDINYDEFYKFLYLTIKHGNFGIYTKQAFDLVIENLNDFDKESEKVLVK